MSEFASACRRRPAHIALGTLLTVAWLPLPGSGATPPGCPELRPAADRVPLPGTVPLEMQGDIGLQLVEANGRFLDGLIAAAAQARASRWKPDTASAAAYEASVKPHRDALAKMLGIGRDPRPAHPAFEYYGAHRDGPLASAPGLTVRSVRWPAFGDVHGEGLLIEPEGAASGADIVAIPDAGQTPEDIAGLTGRDATTGSVYALRLAQAGCRVLVPALIGRETNAHGMTQREWLHRPAFVLGRHLLGFEAQKVLAGADCLRASQGAVPRRVGVAGWGEGGLLALYAAALDPRIDAACVSGYFGPREALWNEPAEHNVFGLLNVFGDAEIAALVAPRPLTIESGVYPDFVFRPGPDGEPECIAKRPGLTGKPGRFFRPAPGAVAAEIARIQALAGPLGKVRSVISDRPLGDAAIASLCEALGAPSAPRPAPAAAAWGPGGADAARIAARQAAQISEIERHTQAVLVRA
ncbi:MAG: dienelactone hydrolase family protein, partial [Verrucomicrobia bacterium]|nr:dienelactone hydrolase family protein [Verrucomicrobiota bacterium]